jgi:hypothetical protein
MPPLPPNLTRSGLIRTVPAWNQQTASRRDTHTRFLSKRFPVRPSSDTNWVNPSLPPGSTRLAQPKGIRGRASLFPAPAWIEIFTTSNPSTNDDTVPTSLSISQGNLQFAVGWSGKDDANVGVVRTYIYGGTPGAFSVKGADDIATIAGVDYARGTAVALADDPDILYMGIPSLASSGTPGNGQVYHYAYTAAWAYVDPEMNYDPPALNANYGTSIALSDYDTGTARWYTTHGAPGAPTPYGGAMYVATLVSTGAWYANIGAQANAVLTGPVGSEFGHSSAISNYLPASKTIRAVAGAPGATDSDASLFRVVKGVSGTPWVWTTLFEVKVAVGALGTSVAMSADGTIVVAGDPANSQVCVYYNSGSEITWTALGTVPAGTTSTSELGQSVSIDRAATASSLNGTMIAVGEPGYDAPGRPGAGRVIVYEYSNGTWLTVLNPVVGSAENENFGETVVLSGTEWFVAAGSRDLGRIAVYSTTEVPVAAT